MQPKSHTSPGVGGSSRHRHLSLLCPRAGRAAIAAGLTEQTIIPASPDKSAHKKEQLGSRLMEQADRLAADLAVGVEMGEQFRHRIAAARRDRRGGAPALQTARSDMEHRALVATQRAEQELGDDMAAELAEPLASLGGFPPR